MIQFSFRTRTPVQLPVVAQTLLKLYSHLVYVQGLSRIQVLDQNLGFLRPLLK